MKAVSYNVDSKLFTSSSLEVGRDDNKTIFTCVHFENKNLFQYQQANSVKIGTNPPLVKGILNCSNEGSGSVQRGDTKENGVL
jgi:hypothetical protein